MQKLFILGNGSLPIEKGIKNQTAFGLRTWQFLSILKNFKGKTRILILTENDFYNKKPEFWKPEQIEIFGKKVEIFRVNKNSLKFKSFLKTNFREFSPTVCLGVNLFSSFCLSKICKKIPFWADLNGWSLAEAQSQSFIEKSNDYLPIIWEMEKTILQKADKISTVSKSQKLATIGQLSTLMRLNSFTENYNFVQNIPNANELNLNKKIVKKHILADFNLPKDSFKILFSGAYNTWLDEENLFKGLELAMKKNPDIYFISTGGSASVSNKVFRNFKSKIDSSKFREKFIFLGWIDKNDLENLYSEVNLAINLDRKNMETIFGARNRMNEWLNFSVPIISTVGTEISQDLARNNLIIPVKLEDFKNLADQILQATKTDLKFMAKEAKKFNTKNYSYEKTLNHFSKWLNNPKKSPDFAKKISKKTSSIKKLLFRLKNKSFSDLVKYLKGFF